MSASFPDGDEISPLNDVRVIPRLTAKLVGESDDSFDWNLQNHVVATKNLRQIGEEAFRLQASIRLPNINRVFNRPVKPLRFPFAEKGNQLARLLEQYRIENVQTRAHALEYRGGTVEGQRFYEDNRLGETLLPFIRKWTRLPEDYQTLRQQLLIDMQQPDFIATWRLLTAWGLAT